MDELMKFNPYEVTINYNEHKGVYATIESYYEENKYEFIDYDECIRKQQVFQIRVYPTTAIGFYQVFASEYQLALEKMCEILSKEQ